MSERRRALGRGLGALIPSGTGESHSQRPVDVFFQDRADSESAPEGVSAEATPEEQEAVRVQPQRQERAAATANRAAPEAPSNVRTGAAASGPSNAQDDATYAVPGDAQNEAPLTASEAVLQELEESQSAPDPAATTGVSTAKKKQAPKARQKRAASTPSASKQQATTPASTSPAEASSEELQPVPGATFAEVPIDSLSPNASQPRQVFDEDELNELAGSIREVGVLQPVVVRLVETDTADRTSYELIMGERRWRAARIAGLDTIPAIIRQTAHEDMLRDALLENLHRVQLNPLEEAAAYQQLLEDFGCTHDELAVRIARSRPQISNTLRLLKLPPLVQRRVAAGILSAGHSRALLGLSDPAAMERLAQRIVAEGLSVRATEEIIALGDEPMQPEMRRRPRDSGHAMALNELAGRLSDNLDTKVKVKLGQRKGQVSIEFASMGDLNRILGVLTPSDPGVSEEAQDFPETENSAEENAVDTAHRHD